MSIRKGAARMSAKRAEFPECNMTRVQLLIGGSVLYLILILSAVWALFSARSQMLAAYTAKNEQANWDEFRREMDRRHRERESLRGELGQHSGQPVAVQPPKKRSARPPTLELLENHFTACLVVSLAGVTLLFAIMWGFFMGAMLRPGRRFEESPKLDGVPESSN